MTQINLLPDVKQQFMRANRLRRTTMVISFIIASAALALFIFLLLTVKVWQKAHIGDLNKDIAKASKQLSDVPNLNRILTVQQQLKSLPSLHAQKPAAKRLLGYISQVTPLNVTVSKTIVNFQTNTFELNGAAKNLEDINKFVDTLKFTKFKNPETNEEKPSFTNVVLTSFGRDSDEATYVINLAFDPLIFDSKFTDLKLNVPQGFITTRSETERPSALFETSDPKPAGDQNGGDN